MILITGGTGLVGSHLLYKLLQTEEKVRAIYRREHKLDAVKHVFSYYEENPEVLYNKIEWVEADIINIPKLQEAFKDITYVYHCAAFISFEPDKYRTLKNINTKGTANIVNLCISNSVTKLCYVSTIAAIGKTSNPEKLINETTAWNPEEDNSVYGITKYGAELEVWRGTQEGLDAVIVNPGIILGPGFWRNGSGNVFKKIHKGLKYYAQGSSGYVAVFDVVNAMIQLMKSSIKNESYILVAENISFKNFTLKTAEALGVSKKNKLIKPWQLGVLWRLDWLKHKLFGKRRQLAKQMTNSLITETKYDNTKLKKALDFEFTSVDVSIKEVSEFYLKDSKN